MQGRRKKIICDQSDREAVLQMLVVLGCRSCSVKLLRCAKENKGAEMRWRA